MKKQLKRLSLGKETVRTLDARETALIVGGSDLQNSCGSICYTDKHCGGRATIPI